MAPTVLPGTDTEQSGVRATGRVSSEFGDFLRSRRDAETPEVAGVSSWGQRRVPGLRREELAQIAGISVNYYTRLEQGQSSNE
ncbi:helix-turn-helix domain-containing protein [Microbacterium sp. NPDC007973]|uniref:helix-turn-helix domain-containing protein n=1 Tax=Microbacterium sp. NPDC007973 TaxID=3364182 RepID=UPI0036E15196